MIDGPQGWHLECKRVEKLNHWAAYDRAVAEAPAGSVAMVAMRRNGGPWLGLVDLDVLLALIAWQRDVGALMQRVDLARLRQ